MSDTPESDALFLRQVSDEGTCVVRTNWKEQYEGCQSLERRLAVKTGQFERAKYFCERMLDILKDEGK